MENPGRKIEVVAYNKDWPTHFEKEAARVRDAIEEGLMEVHHIGSTAVPGLSAKPIIDLLLEVSDLALLDRFDSKMELLGYSIKGEYGIPGRRFYLKGLIHRTHHIHAFESGSAGFLRHLALRDFLRTHPVEAMKYGELKQEIAGRFPLNNDGYCEAKHDFVQQLEKRALRWAEELRR